MKKIIYALLISMTLLATPARADISTYTLLEPLPCVPTERVKCNPGETIKQFTVDQFIEYVFKFAIALAVLLATIQVIIGGFQYMGNDSYSSKNDAKKRFWNAATGLGGALVSFLILRTIDPRLVQVHTTIDPICTTAAKSDSNSICYAKDVASFRGKLDKDLKNLSTDNLNKVSALQAEIDSRKGRIDELTAKFASAEGVTNEEWVELEQLRRQNDAAQALQTKLIATGTANAYFRGAIEDIHKPSMYDKNGVMDVSTKNGIDLEKGKIYTSYTNYIDNPEISNDPAAKADLQFQRDFYLSQIDKEAALISSVVKFNNTPPTTESTKSYIGNIVGRVIGGGGIIGTVVGGVVSSNISGGQEVNKAYVQQKADLKATQINYSDQLSFLNSTASTPGAGLDPNLAKIKTNPITLEQYKTTLGDRINTINSALALKP